MTQEEILSFLSQHKQEFENRYSITKIGLFGSVAKNEHGKDSDIDLVVEMHEKNYFKLIEFENYLKEHFHNKIDVGFLKSMKSYIQKQISKDLIYV